jgi:hypothetical protein
MRCTNLSFWGGKNKKRSWSRPGVELTTSISEGESANHYTMPASWLEEQNCRKSGKLEGKLQGKKKEKHFKSFRLDAS